MAEDQDLCELLSRHRDTLRQVCLENVIILGGGNRELLVSKLVNALDIEDDMFGTAVWGHDDADSTDSRLSSPTQVLANSELFMISSLLLKRQR